jgi:hypothetical protein
MNEMSRQRFENELGHLMFVQQIANHLQIQKNIFSYEGYEAMFAEEKAENERKEFISKWAPKE